MAKNSEGMSKTAKSKRKQPSGASKLRSSGKHAVLLGILPEWYKTIARAAGIEMRSVSGFIVRAAWIEACHVIDLKEGAK